MGIRRRRGKGGDKPVTSYTLSSIIMYMPFSASLCVATSATEKVFDILALWFSLRLGNGEGGGGDFDAMGGGEERGGCVWWRKGMWSFGCGIRGGLKR